MGKGKKKKGKKKKKKGKSWNQRKFAFRIFLRDYTLALSTLFVVLSLLFIILGGLGIFMYDTNKEGIPQPVRDWVAAIHEVDSPEASQIDLCLFPIGFLLIIIAGWYLGSSIYKRKAFNRLMETESKSKFIEDLDEVERLAWELSTKHERLVMKKKKELGLKK